MRESADQLIIEDGSGLSGLPSRLADLALGTMEEHGLVAFDAAGVLHPTDKARELLEAPAGKAVTS